MEKMMVASLGINFDPKKTHQEYTLNLPQKAQILSISLKESAIEPTLWVQYMYPVPTELLQVQEFSFVIVSCNYTKVTIDNHNYIGTINIDNNIFVVFCKEGPIIQLT